MLPSRAVLSGLTAGTLTFMVGGSDVAFARGEPDPSRDGQEHRAFRRLGRRAGRKNLQ